MFAEALQEYKEMERVSDTNNNKMDVARCNRMIGEVYCEMSDFDKALKHQKKHLKISCEEDDKVEQQRALATIGRTYFLHAESCSELLASSKSASLSEAKKHFFQSLSICEQLGDNAVGMKQRMEMRLRLFLNLGLVLESQGQLDQAVEHLSKAIMISKKLEFWEELMRTYSALGSVYQKKHASSLALSTFDQAITVAERLSDKAQHIATILILKAEVLLELPDFLGARQALFRAYRLNISSNKSDKMEIEKKLRIVAAMCETEQALTNLAPDGDYMERKKLYEDLGDMASEIASYTTALTYYHLMLECVEKCGKKREALIECYVSLAQTYKDNKQYGKALEYFKKELELEEENPSEACKTNMNIAELFNLIGDTEKMVEYYEKAKISSESAGSDKLKKIVLQCAFNALTDAKCFTKATEIQRELVNFTYLDVSESDSEDEERKQYGLHIDLDDLSDIDGAVNDEDEKRKITRTRVKPKTNLQKRNEKGETPLHLAAISGNATLVGKLIDQGHSVDVKDFSGWTPLHEACNHGHRDVAEVLLSKGAAVNDRGGPHCDGFTPLLDAASNGSLDCMELLLSYGASPLMRTNSGESVLDCLESWRNRRLSELGSDLDECTLAQYLSIYKKIQQILEKAGQKISNKESLCSEDSSIKEGRHSMRSEHSVKHSAPAQRRKSKDNINSSRLNPVEDAADEYENAMKALRFKHQHIVSPMAKPAPIPALLPSDECVGDNWLEEDFDLIRPNKKRRVCEFGGGQPQRRRSRSATGGGLSEQFSRSNPSPTPSEDGSVANSTDSEDINVMLTAFKNTDGPAQSTSAPEESKDSPSTSGVFSNKLKEMNAVRRKQISLMATGVTKEKVVKTSQTSELSLPDLNPTLSCQQYTYVKVRVEGKLLLVPLPQCSSQTLTISWLANELATRYRSLEGIEPILRIETQDGALLVDSDPVALLLGMGELNGRVQSWKLPPLSTIYQEACLSGNTVAEGQVIAELDACLATNSVNLDDLFLDNKQLGPILKALSYHLPLQVLSLSGNNISDAYMKDVANCLVKLSQLKLLDLSNINISANGLATLARIIVDNKALQRLESLYLGCNPLSDCLSSLAELLNIIPSLRKLSLPSVNLTPESFRSCPYYSLDCLERLDVNLNEVGSEGVIDLLGRLNHHAIVELKMAGTGANTIREVAFFLQHYSPPCLTLLDLSYCSATDYDIGELVKGIENCRQLTQLCLDGIVGITSRSVAPLLGLSSVRELSLCGLEASQPIQVSDHLSSLTIGSCVDQAWVSQRGPFGFNLCGTAVLQRTTTH
ncbi:tonsoku-like protein isoform X2 [Rhodnius prolixus]